LAKFAEKYSNYLKHLNDGNFGRSVYNTNQSNFLIPPKPTALCRQYILRTMESQGFLQIAHPKNYREPGQNASN
jgi:hypothetical protein